MVVRILVNAEIMQLKISASAPMSLAIEITKPNTPQTRYLESTNGNTNSTNQPRKLLN